MIKVYFTVGAATPEFMAVRTPATKEHERVLNKRKCIFDDIIVFPNKYVLVTLSLTPFVQVKLGWIGLDLLDRQCFLLSLL